VNLLERILGFAQISESPEGGNQRGFQFDEIVNEDANVTNHTLDGTNRQATAQEMEWLKLRLERGARERFAGFGKLTPGIAQVLLSRNDENRPLVENRAQVYARDIAAGNWELNGEPIVISSCGQVNDGQHRCRAVVLAKCPIDTVFVFGVSHESRKTTDQGAAKSAGDYLGMDGIKNANNVASIANLVMQIERRGRPSANAYERPTKTEVRNRCEADTAIADSFEAVRIRYATKVASYSVLGACHYLFAQVDRDAADLFMRQLITGVGLSARDPIYVLREKLTDPYRRLKQQEVMRAIFTAWNHWRKGKSVKTIVHTLRAGEKLPEVK